MEVTKKFIIENHTDIGDHIIMERIVHIMDMGLISNNKKQYCHATRFVGCVVEMIKTKYGYRILILDSK